LWNAIHPKTFTKQYKNHLSDFIEWSERTDTDALVFPENCGEHLSLDETMLLNGEYYTVLTNKAAHGKKGALVALIKGTKTGIVTEALARIPVAVRMKVKSISLDLASNMEWIASQSFMNAIMVGDRFHVQKVVSEAVQEVRMKYRREAIDEDNAAHEVARKAKVPYHPKRYENGDSKKQLLARGRHLLFKPQSKWTEQQQTRAAILFREFPEIHQAYKLSMNFRSIFENAKTKDKARERIEDWTRRVECSEIQPLISAAKTVKNHLGKILNYFPGSTTNAAAESFNAKLKGFRSLVRGVRDHKFFLYRICKFYA
jgi:transposase